MKSPILAGLIALATFGCASATDKNSSNASAAPALIVSTEMEGIAGEASAVMQVSNVNGNPGKGKVRPEAEAQPPGGVAGAGPPQQQQQQQQPPAGPNAESKD